MHYQQISSERRTIIQEVDKIKNYYIVDIIMNQLIEDALSPDVAYGDVLTVTSTKPEIQKELDYLF